MKELHLGKMNNKELAEWFGITEGSFRTSKKKKLEELKYFANFEEVGKKIEILEIKDPIYSKQRSKAYQLIRDNVDNTWNEDGLDSCKRVSLEIKNKLGNDLTVKESTIYDYTRESRNELYGIPFQKPGAIGSCKYLWCKKEGNGALAKYYRLTPEEEELKQQLIKKYFGNTTEKQIFVKGMVEKGEIKKEDAWKVLEDITNMDSENFYTFLNELQIALGCTIVKGTQVNRNREIEEKEFNWGE